MSTNVTLNGTVGRDPELRFTPAGKAVATVSVVTSRGVKNDDGKWENHEETWWRVTAWEKLAENITETLRKGDPVVVVGRAFTEKYTDKEGNERQSLKVNAYNVALDLSRRTASVHRVEASKPSGSWSAGSVSEDDIPPF